MSAFNKPGESWQDFAARQQAECERAQLQPQPGSLAYAALYQTVTKRCEGCGASTTFHPLQNANAKGANECSYCRRPFFDLNRLSLT